MLGANPFASNGSLLTAPDLPGRLRALRARGGRLVVVDPRRTKTAEEADEHVAIRPGTDALVPLRARPRAVRRGPRRSRRGRRPRATGSTSCARLRDEFAPERVAQHTGVDADTIAPHRTRARRARRRAAVYARIGTCTQEFGTLASWLVDVLNVLTGNLDRPGGAMFAKPAAGGANTGGKPRRRARRALRAPASPRARAARVLRRAPGRLPGRGDRDAGRRSGPRAAHDGRQPGASPRPTRTGSTARSPRSSSW